MDDASRLDPIAARLQWRRRARKHPPDFLRAAVDRGLLERLEPMRIEPETILVASCGQSSALLTLAQRFDRAALLGAEDDEQALVRWRDCFEPRPSGWLARLRRSRPSRATRLLAADPLALPLGPGSVDLVLSALQLHACPQPARQLAEWLRILRPGGLLSFACFGVDTLSELRGLGARMHPFPDMHDLGDAMMRAGFAEPVVDTERLSVTWRDPATLLSEVHRWGGNALADRFRGLLTPRHRHDWLKALETLRGPDGLIRMSVELIFGHAWCPSSKPLADGLAPVRLVRRGDNTGR